MIISSTLILTNSLSAFPILFFEKRTDSVLHLAYT